MNGRDIISQRELRDALEDVADRTRDASFIRDKRDEPSESVPNDDEQWSVADVIGEMMCGAYAHGARVDIHGYRLYNSTVSDDLANVWIILSPDGGCAVDAINLGAFRSAAEIETYITDLAERRDRRGG